MSTPRNRTPISRTVEGNAPSERIHSLARSRFDIETLHIGQATVRVTQSDQLSLPFDLLTTFSHPKVGPRRILVVAPLAGGFPVLLRDLVVGLLRHDTVSVTDWLDARYVPAHEGQFGLEDNIRYVMAMMRQLGPELDVVAVCQGAVAALAATALIATESPDQAPRSLVLIGGPVDPLANATRVVRLVRACSLQWLQNNVIEAVPAGFPGEGRLVYPAGHQRTTFSAYLARHLAARGELLWKLLRDDGEDPVRFPFLRLCLLMMDLPAQFFLDNIREVYHRRSLLTGDLLVGDKRVNLPAIRRTALMTIEGQDDDIAAPGQTHAACVSVPEEWRSHLLVPGSGHFSLFHGGIWRQTVLPGILSFLEKAPPVSGRHHGAPGHG
ncbi:polyhydroxyalkanoate depolymerase [Microvirga sp. P5_D2]